MNKETLDRLLNKACEIINSLEHAADDDLKKEIDALYNEIDYCDYLDSEMENTGPKYDSDQEAQNWETFGDKKI